MSNLAATEQSAPEAGSVPVLPTVLMYLQRDGRGALGADLKERAKAGKQRYGTVLMAHNGRDALVDLYQELLDALMYLAQYGMETGEDVWDDFDDLKRIAMRTKEKLGAD